MLPLGKFGNKSTELANERYRPLSVIEPFLE